VQELLGALVIVGTAIAFLGPRLLHGSQGNLRTPPLTPAARKGLMAALTIVAAAVALPAFFAPARKGIFAFCAACPVVGGAETSASSPAQLPGVLLLAEWHYAATILPVFVIACAASGLLTARGDRLRVHGFLGSFALASALPVCSCGVVPLARSLMARGGQAIRDGVVLLIAAPLLSPVIIFLGLAVLGPTYVALRVLASLAIAAVAVPVVLPLLPPELSAMRETARPAISPPALEAGWNTLRSLARYVLLGVFLGALVAVAVPRGAVASALSAGPLATAALVVAGVPISMCAGEEILVVAPFTGAGLTMGNAIAFALAGAGICIGSIPLLLAVLGRKGTLAVIALYLILPFVTGVLIDLVPGLPLGAGQLPVP
jgi:uncharacterized membrane protein YraQ (UPF0718 family)